MDGLLKMQAALSVTKFLKIEKTLNLTLMKKNFNKSVLTMSASILIDWWTVKTIFLKNKNLKTYSCSLSHMNIILLGKNRWPQVIYNILLKITIIKTKTEKILRIFCLEEEARVKMMMNLLANSTLKLSLGFSTMR